MPSRQLLGHQEPGVVPSHLELVPRVAETHHQQVVTPWGRLRLRPSLLFWPPVLLLLLLLLLSGRLASEPSALAACSRLRRVLISLGCRSGSVPAG